MRIPFLSSIAAGQWPGRRSARRVAAAVMFTQLASGTAQAVSVVEPKAELAAAPISLSRDFNPTTRFDPTTGVTRITGIVARDLCVMLTLPLRWETADDRTAGLRETRSGVELALSVRAVDAPTTPLDPDLTSRDAHLLQSEYEDLFGRPAQAVALTRLASGLARWTATWIDANFSNPAHSLTTEAFLVELPQKRVLEMSLSNVGTREAYEDLAQEVLSRLKVSGAGQCGREGL
jgi:hypothetical protein